MTTQDVIITESLVDAFKLTETLQAHGIDSRVLGEALAPLVGFVRTQVRKECADACLKLANTFATELEDLDMSAYAATRKQNQMNGAVKCHEAILAMEA